MEGSGSSSQVVFHIVSMFRESEEEEPGGRLLAVSQVNRTLL